MKRGRYSRSFLHLAIMIVIGLGVMLAPFLASTYPVFSDNTSPAEIDSPSQNQSIIVGEDVIKTDISQKPRDKVIVYKVEKGDTISTIGKKFGVSSDTIKWENNLIGDSLNVGDELKVLPVSGMSHKVVSGDTVYSIAKRYDTEAQRIVDFPFNDFANPQTFSLVIGQILIVPDGVKPAAVLRIQAEDKFTLLKVRLSRCRPQELHGPSGELSDNLRAGITWRLISCLPWELRLSLQIQER